MSVCTHTLLHPALSCTLHSPSMAYTYGWKGAPWSRAWHLPNAPSTHPQGSCSASTGGGGGTVQKEARLVAVPLQGRGQRPLRPSGYGSTNSGPAWGWSQSSGMANQSPEFPWPQRLAGRGSPLPQ